VHVPHITYDSFDVKIFALIVAVVQSIGGNIDCLGTVLLEVCTADHIFSPVHLD
jgi:hypothetical protein